MAGKSGKDDDLGDVYELLGIDEDAAEKEIQAAYRKGSLKCHPDRNPDDPDAAQKFDKLTRAKDLLLDPIRRSELDRKRKAERDVKARNAQEDDKRRKLREDLEGRESAANLKSQAARSAAEAQEARHKLLKQDFAARIRAREEQMADRHKEVIAEVAEARSNALEARIRLTWRGNSEPDMEIIRKELQPFNLKTIGIVESTAIVQLGSREDALKAVLHAREQKNKLPFKVSLATSKTTPKEAPPPTPVEPPKKRTEGNTQGPPAATAVAGKPAAPAASSFDDWEAKMLAEMQSLAAKQRSTASPAS